MTYKKYKIGSSLNIKFVEYLENKANAKHKIISCLTSFSKNNAPYQQN